jgi:hypothetical protein
MLFSDVAERAWQQEGERMAARAGTGKKKTFTQRQKEEEKRERSEKLNAQRDSLQSRLNAVEALLSGFEIPQLEGTDVEHTQYGHGTVIKQQDAVITVRYESGEKKQKLPFVVSGGFLHLNDPSLETQMAHMEELNRQKDSLVKEIRYMESLLGDLEKS